MLAENRARSRKVDRETHRNHVRRKVDFVFRSGFRRKGFIGLDFRLSVDSAGWRQREFLFHGFLRQRTVFLPLGFRGRFRYQSLGSQARLLLFGRISGNPRRYRFRMKQGHRASRGFGFRQPGSRRRRNPQRGRFLSARIRSRFQQGVPARSDLRFELLNLLNLRGFAQFGKRRQQMPVFLRGTQGRRILKGFL